MFLCWVLQTDIRMWMMQQTRGSAEYHLLIRFNSCSLKKKSYCDDLMWGCPTVRSHNIQQEWNPRFLRIRCLRSCTRIERVKCRRFFSWGYIAEGRLSWCNFQLSLRIEVDFVEVDGWDYRFPYVPRWGLGKREVTVLALHRELTKFPLPD